MAIKIYTNGIMNYRKPLSNDFFNKDEIALELNTDIKNIRLLDMGPFILALNEYENEINAIASIFFRFRINGDVLLIAGRELSEEDMITEENTKYEIEDVETGILKSIKDTILIYQMVMNNNKENDKISDIVKKVYYYDPDKNIEKLSDIEKKFTVDFFKSAYDSLTKFNNENSELKLSDLILLEDQDIIVKFPPDEKKIETIFQKMINYFVSIEEYEKCKILKDTLEKSKDNEKLI